MARIFGTVLLRGGKMIHLLSYLVDNKTITAHLNGYAIIPLERYCELAGEPFNSDRMKEADYQLNKERRNDKLVG